MKFSENWLRQLEAVEGKSPLTVKAYRADVLKDVADQADESGIWWTLDWPDARPVAARLALGSC